MEKFLAEGLPTIAMLGLLLLAIIWMASLFLMRRVAVRLTYVGTGLVLKGATAGVGETVFYVSPRCPNLLEQIRPFLQQEVVLLICGGKVIGFQQMEPTEKS